MGWWAGIVIERSPYIIYNTIGNFGNMSSETRNVVLLVLDTIRKDYFDTYCRRLRRLSDVSFEECRAASSWSVPSQASIFTGKLPTEHGNHSGQIAYESLDEHGLLFDDLEDHRTIGISANGYANSSFRFDVHFDEFVDIYPGVRYPSALDVRQVTTESESDGIGVYWDFLRRSVTHEQPLQSVANGAAAWIQAKASASRLPQPFDDGAKTACREGLKAVESGSEPFFLFMNIMDAHSPHGMTRGYHHSLLEGDWFWTSNNKDYIFDIDRQLGGEHSDIHNFREYYKLAVEYVDRVVAGFIEDLVATTDRKTTVIVTADHGENLAYFQDDRQMGHVFTKSLTEALLHVPFEIINPPRGYQAQENGYISHLDLPQLVVGLATDQTPEIVRDTVAAEVLGIGTLSLERLRETSDVSLLDEWDRFIRCIYSVEGKQEWCDADESKAPAIASDVFPKSMAQYSQDIESVSSNLDISNEATARLKRLGYL